VGETAIVVLVPEAEQAVGSLYRTHTRAGREGMSPHVTLLIPFADSESLPLDEVRAVLGRFEQFDFQLTELRRFEPRSGPPILWLEPDPAASFVTLTEALVQAFPDYVPYGGAFAEIVPHLTVADARDERTPARIQRDVVPALPIAARADAVTIVQRVDGRWQPHTRIPLGVS